ncbi:MAG: class I SAM-dependent methyltransferase [Candidatus Thorarchaeota archaeon]|nr:MAG: class I SAM-dependent methyltransferase [Candidatus Thorarchaeota archaeon]
MTDRTRGDSEGSDRVKRMIETYAARYDDPFWNALTELIETTPRNRIVDFGCGPGLFLIDAAWKYRAKWVYGFDSSPEMLGRANEFLSERLKDCKYEVEGLDVNVAPIPLPDKSIDLAFSGFFLHELSNPRDHVSQVYKVLSDAGVYAIYDFISGNEESFVERMIATGWSEERARDRYPSMCKHSLEDIESLLKSSGFQIIKSNRIEDIRAIVVGAKQAGPGTERSNTSMRHRSPWAYDDSDIRCPRCTSHKIIRCHDRWATSRGVQMFECTTCGKRFVDRGYDDYLPTFIR